MVLRVLTNLSLSGVQTMGRTYWDRLRDRMKIVPTRSDSLLIDPWAPAELLPVALSTRYLSTPGHDECHKLQANFMKVKCYFILRKSSTLEWSRLSPLASQIKSAYQYESIALQILLLQGHF